MDDSDEMRNLNILIAGLRSEIRALQHDQRTLEEHNDQQSKMIRNRDDRINELLTL
jgi:hypothetical protein